VAGARLALLKADLAGSMEVGLAFLKMVKPFVFRTAQDKIISGIGDRAGSGCEMIDANGRSRPEQQWLGIGGMGVEFLVQTVQVIAGRK
jgi:glutamine synthetase adenylyltransferase